MGLLNISWQDLPLDLRKPAMDASEKQHWAKIRCLSSLEFFLVPSESSEIYSSCHIAQFEKHPTIKALHSICFICVNTLTLNSLDQFPGVCSTISVTYLISEMYLFSYPVQMQPFCKSLQCLGNPASDTPHPHLSCPIHRHTQFPIVDRERLLLALHEDRSHSSSG